VVGDSVVGGAAVGSVVGGTVVVGSHSGSCNPTEQAMLGGSGPMVADVSTGGVVVVVVGSPTGCDVDGEAGSVAPVVVAVRAGTANRFGAVPADIVACGVGPSLGSASPSPEALGTAELSSTACCRGPSAASPGPGSRQLRGNETTPTISIKINTTPATNAWRRCNSSMCSRPDDTSVSRRPSFASGGWSGSS
jgi:hypothetical protein